MWLVDLRQKNKIVTASSHAFSICVDVCDDGRITGFGNTYFSTETPYAKIASVLNSWRDFTIYFTMKLSTTTV